ncbi:gamma-aminobutyric acid receptor subunit alpha-2-like [Clytia hemisphaerica]
MLFYFVVILFANIFDASSKRSDGQIRKEWNSLLKGYNRHIRPNYTGSATNVHLTIKIQSFREINERKMSYGIDIWMSQKWEDYRLKHNISKVITPLLGLGRPSNLIWVPDTVFINEINSKQHLVTVRNNKVDINSDGTVHLISRVTVVASCRMNFRFYPLDTQFCYLFIESFAYPDTYVDYNWRVGVIVEKYDLSQYTLEKVETFKNISKYESGNYTILQVMFRFKRGVEVSVIQVFFPIVSVVCVSMISLWLNKYSTSSRVALCVTTLLTLCTLWTRVNFSLPLVSYFKALDWYFLVSFVFILLVLVEYTIVVNVDTSREKKKVKNAKKEEKRNSLKNASLKETALDSARSRKASEAPGAPVNVKEVLKRKRKVKFDDYETGTSRIDRVARFLIPCSYFLYNIYFWFVFMDERHAYAAEHSRPIHK